MQNSPSMWAGFLYIPIIWNEYADWICIKHEKLGVIVMRVPQWQPPSASPCSQNRHFHALKGTSQHWRPIALDAMPRRERGRKKKLGCWELQLIFVGLSLSSSSSSVFPVSPVLSTVSQPLAFLLAFSTLSQWGSTSQWICPGCWH